MPLRSIVQEKIVLSRIAIIFFGCLATWHSYALDGVPNAIAPTVLIRVAATFDDNQWNLRASLTNSTDSSVTMQKAEIPWLSPSRLFVVAHSLDKRCSGERLEDDTMAILDAPVGNVVLAPNQTISGDVPLGLLLISAEKAAHKCEVVVFWAYKARTRDLVGLPVQAGAVVLRPEAIPHK